MTLRIELATPEQAHLVHQSMRAAYAEYDGVLVPPSGAVSETVAAVEQAMSKGGALLAWVGDEVVGSARFQWNPDHLYIGRVGVIPSHRGHGIGAALMARIEAIACDRGASRILFGVRQSLPGNVAFYQRLGYEVIKIEPHPKGGDSVVWMGKQLEPLFNNPGK